MIIIVVGWDSPDEFGISETLGPPTSSPGPSGVSGPMLFSRSWSPPITTEHVLTDESSSIEQDGTHHRTSSSPDPNISDVHKHRYKGKGKRRALNKRTGSTTGSNCIAVSYLESAADCQSDGILISSEEATSPILSQETEDEDRPPKSIKNSKRCCSNEETSSRSRSKSHKDSHKSHGSKKAARKRSHDRGRDKPHSSSRASKSRRRTRSTRSRSPAAGSTTHTPDSLAGSSEYNIERPLSPTEEEIKREISELEQKIADDTKRLTQLLLKQEKRRLGNCSVSGRVVCTTEDSGTDELSR